MPAYCGPPDAHHAGGLADRAYQQLLVAFSPADIRLGRSVAIKFLPEAFAHDGDRVGRFEREARVLASLSHRPFWSGDGQSIGLLETNRGVLSRFTFEKGDDLNPVWSPDGGRIVFGSNRRDSTAIACT